MRARRQVLVHVGLHKTGSSWLKTHVFRAEPFVEVLSVAEAMDQVVRPPGARLPTERGGRPRGSSDSEALQQRCTLHRHRLSGNPHAGSYDKYVLADRLIESIPNVGFLVVFRRQQDMLASLYYQYVRRPPLDNLTHCAARHCPPRGAKLVCRGRSVIEGRSLKMEFEPNLNVIAIGVGLDRNSGVPADTDPSPRGLS